MAIYTMRGIDDNLWKKVKGETGYRGINIRALILDFLRNWVKDSQTLRRRERKAGTNWVKGKS